MTEIVIPEASAFQAKALTVLEQAKAIVISTQEQFVAAGEFLKGLKAYSKELDATFDGVIKRAHEAHKAAKAAKDLHAKPIADAEAVLKQKLVAFQIDQEARAAEERKRLQAIADKAAEDQAVAMAATLEAAGEKAEAEALLSEPITAAAVAAPVVATVAGVSFRAKWDGEVEDLMALVKSVAAGSAPISLLTVDKTALRKYAEATKGAVPIVGVKWTKSLVASSRTNKTEE